MYLAGMLLPSSSPNYALLRIASRLFTCFQPHRMRCGCLHLRLLLLSCLLGQDTEEFNPSNTAWFDMYDKASGFV